MSDLQARLQWRASSFRAGQSPLTFSARAQGTLTAVFSPCCMAAVRLGQGQHRGEPSVAMLPQSASPHQLSSPFPLFRGAFWQLHSFLQAKKSRSAAICSKTPHALHRGQGRPDSAHALANLL